VIKNVNVHERIRHQQGWKRWFFKGFGFYGFLKTKKPRKVEFFGFYGFSDIVADFMRLNVQLLFIYYNLTFNLHEFIFYSIYYLHYTPFVSI